MSVLMRTHGVGSTEEHYRGVIGPVTDFLRAANGFVAHYAFMEGDGLTISEIWNSRAEFEAYFNEHIVPMLPEGAPAPEFFEIMNTITP